LVDDERWERFRQRRERYDRNFQRVRQTLVKKPNGQTCHAIDALRDQRSSLAQMYQLGHIELEIDSSGLDLDVSSVEIEVKYEGYLKREIATVARSKREENRAIPSDFPFGRVPGLSKELAERFTEIKPETLGQASRLSGATPASIAVLAAFLGRLSGDGLTDR
jgi:tRNA uridine 5-carboxymethylaminomethyl modification enzyme